jgi:hypothetical protein
MCPSPVLPLRMPEPLDPPLYPPLYDYTPNEIEGFEKAATSYRTQAKNMREQALHVAPKIRARMNLNATRIEAQANDFAEMVRLYHLRTGG